MRAQVALVLAAAPLIASCSSRNLGLPLMTAFQPSPDGSFTAFVRNHPSVDPPRQSLWLQRYDSPDAQKLRTLGEDSDWCNVVVWSSDSSLVAFVVQEAWVAVYEAASAHEVLVRDLVSRGAYPTSTMVYGLRFTEDNSVLSYLECDRGSGRQCHEREIALPEV